MGRAPCCDKANVKKGPWSPEEDAKLKTYIEQNGTGGNWIALPQKIGLKRCGKSCRLRWLNYLRPNIKHGGFSEEEDNIICSLYVNIGSRWSIIAAQLPGRTDNDIKNYWNTRLKKKLLGKQRKEQQAQAQARRMTNKQQQMMIKTENENFIIGQVINNNQPPYNYWPSSQYSVPISSYSSSSSSLNNQTSLTSFLVNQHQEPYITTNACHIDEMIPTSSQDHHVFPMNQAVTTCQPSNNNNALFQGGGLEIINYPSDLSVNLQELQGFYYYYYGMESVVEMSNNNNAAASSTTNSTESIVSNNNNNNNTTSCGDMSYSHHFEDCCRHQGIHIPHQQDVVAFENSSYYFGMQLQ